MEHILVYLIGASLLVYGLFAALLIWAVVRIVRAILKD